jgi:DNA-binding MarR family transcriptional regulator
MVKTGRAHARRAGSTAERAALEPAVINAFRRITQALRAADVQTHQQAGISAAQLYVLAQLEETSPLSIGQLAEATMTDRSSVADVVDRLVARRLVRRRIAADDRRRAEVHITERGRQLLARAPQSPTMKLVEGIAGLTDSELLALATGLSRLTEEMGVMDTTAAMLFEPVERTAGNRKRSAAISGGT